MIHNLEFYQPLEMLAMAQWAEFPDLGEYSWKENMIDHPQPSWRFWHTGVWELLPQVSCAPGPGRFSMCPGDWLPLVKPGELFPLECAEHAEQELSERLYHLGRLISALATSHPSQKISRWLTFWKGLPSTSNPHLSPCSPEAILSLPRDTDADKDGPPGLACK